MIQIFVFVEYEFTETSLTQRTRRATKTRNAAKKRETVMIKIMTRTKMTPRMIIQNLKAIGVSGKNQKN